jgi:glycosyl transferase family WbsX
VLSGMMMSLLFDVRLAIAPALFSVKRRRASFVVVLGALALVAGCQPLPAEHDPAGIPRPRPASTGRYQIGAYYFPGWPTKEKWKVLDAFPERRPLLGYYAEGDPTVMDWQIKWAVEHGIGFFAFDWYWDRGQRQLEHALHDGYFKARFRSLLKFCLLWANHNPPGSSSEADLLAVVDFWIANYFRRPEYLTLGGKPVVIVFEPRRLRADMGSEAVTVALRRMRARVVEAGLPGLFLLATVDDRPEELARLEAEGYDAGTGYNYPRAGMADRTALRGAYDDMVDGYERIWTEVARAGILDYVPVTEPGWDSRPWHGDGALVRTGRTPDKFRDMLARARAFVDRHPVAGGKKLVLIEAWNEYGEGEIIEPHREWGFDYLDAIRSVFVAGPTTHRDVVPEDLGLPVPRAP